MTEAGLSKAGQIDRARLSMKVETTIARRTI
jgi:hypothetical protein